MTGWKGTYTYKILSIHHNSTLRRLLSYGPHNKEFTATIQHKEKILNIGIDDPTDEGSFGYDHTICFEIYRKLYRNTERKIAANDLAGKSFNLGEEEKNP